MDESHTADPQEAREQHIGQFREYVIDGTPLERDAVTDLMRHPEVLAGELQKLSSLAVIASAKAEHGSNPNARARFEKVQAIIDRAMEMGYGDDDYHGETSTDRNDRGAPAVKKQYGGRSLGHRRKDASRTSRSNPE